MVAMPTQKLARTQALFFYQIIHLFDGDIAPRAQGERDLPLLDTWIGELRKVGDNLRTPSRAMEGVWGHPPMNWKVRALLGKAMSIPTHSLALGMGFRRVCTQDHLDGLLCARTIRADEG